MKDIITQTIEKVSKRKTTLNRFFIVTRYLRLKYSIRIDRKSLLNRFKSFR